MTPKQYLDEFIASEKIDSTVLAQRHGPNLKYYRDVKNVIDTAFAEGYAKARREIAENALRENGPLDVIAEITGLSEAEVAALRAGVAE